MIGFNRGEFTPTTAVSGIGYADTIFTGMSATVVSPDRRVWNIFDLWTERYPHDGWQLWLPEAQKLGRGRLVRMVDSCLRLGIYPDPDELGLDADPKDAAFWAKAVGMLHTLTVLAMQKTAMAYSPAILTDFICASAWKGHEHTSDLQNPQRRARPTFPLSASRLGRTLPKPASSF